jgi:hypothetical protein
MYWSLTESETLAKVRGFLFNRAYSADNFRALYTILYNINRGKQPARKPEELWPLIIDLEGKKELTHEQIVERNTRVKNAANGVTL